MTDSPDFSALKDRMKAMWMAGDFGQIARLNERGAEEFVDRLNLKRGMRVLDVACGTGNQSIPAARTGAEVTGIDIASNLLDQARARARSENLKINFVEGDAEHLPHKDHEFDVVLSMFGAMFAPRPERVIAELLRVCRPGGLIAMANWTPEGFVGKSFVLSSQHVPPPPGIAPPILWGDESVVQQRFGPKAKLRMQKQLLRFEFSQSPKEIVGLFATYFGPTKTGLARLDAPGQEAMINDLIRLWTEHNESRNGGTLVHAEYLEVYAEPA